MVKPEVIALCETKLHANSQLEIEDYKTVKSNLKAGKEGILIAARKGTFISIELIFESESRNIATAEIEYPEDSIRIVVVHGPQEDGGQEDKDDFYNDLAGEVERCLAAEKRLIIAGDLNARLDPGKPNEVKGNGKRLMELVDKYELKVLNFGQKTEGKWTRIQMKDGVECKSEIDYIITDKSTQEKEIKTLIDEEKMFTPYRTKKDGNKKSIVFSDHCTMSSSFEITKGTGGKKDSGKSKYWVLTDDGMEKYKEITKNSVGLEEILEYDEPYDIWRKKINQIMHMCFTKKTLRKDHQNDQPGKEAIRVRRILTDISKRGKVQREIVKEYREELISIENKRTEHRRAMKLKKTVNSLTSNDKLSPNAFWKMRKSVNKNPALKLRAVYKSTGETTTDEEEIKSEISKEFEYRLRNRDPDDGFEGYTEATNSMVEQLLQHTDDKSPPFNRKELDKAICKMKKGTSPDYYGMYADIVSSSGDGILEPLLKVFNKVKSTAKIPETWRQVLITMIYKNKGSRLDLEKYRGIFLTVIASKLFERMLQSRMEPSLEKVSLFQAGSRSGKSAADNLFLLRSTIDHSKYMNNCLYITTYDFRQAFDSIWLQDSILVLRKLGIQDHFLKLIYEMNKKAQVQVKTPYGLTPPIEVNDIVKQGGILGSPMCSATTAEYCEQNKGVTLGDATVASLAFVDDIADLCDDFGDVVISHENAIAFAKMKKLQLAPDKCYVMVIKQKGKTNPVPVLYINGKEVAEVSSITYLGDVFNTQGNNDDLIADRVKRATAALVSISGFMRETSMGQHTLSVYLLLHNAIFLPTILFNSQAWSNITEKNLKELTRIQLRFLKKMMSVKLATSNAFVFLELGVLPIEHELHKRQLLFVYHVMNLGEEDPVKKVWRNQTMLPDHKNWWSDIKKLMQTYSIKLTEEEITSMSKNVFKEKVKKAVNEYAFAKLKAECREQKKTGGLKYEKFTAQPYITSTYPDMAKIIFRCRSRTTNIKDHAKYQHSNSTCRWCGVAEETLDHIVNCGETEENYIENAEKSVDETYILGHLDEIARRVKTFLDKVEF